jgi:hypothetical protein
VGTAASVVGGTAVSTGALVGAAWGVLVITTTAGVSVGAGVGRWPQAASPMVSSSSRLIGWVRFMAILVLAAAEAARMHARVRRHRPIWI